MAIQLAPLNIPQILKQYGLRPDKRLGQNFLVQDSALQRIVEISGVGSADTVLEIGPGLGSLTRYLALSARRVVAVELDGRLMPVLEDVLRPHTNVEVLQADILDVAIDEIMDAQGYVVVANIPYYITSAVIRHLLAATRRPRSITLTVQREVAERICAIPGDHSLLSLSVQIYGEPRLRGRIPAKAFHPAPQVESAVVTVGLYPEPLIPEEDTSKFFSLLKSGFSQKRKNLRNSLAGGMGWTKEKAEALLVQAEIDPTRRAQTLHISEWQELLRLAKALG